MPKVAHSSHTGPLRDAAGVAKFRHEAIAVVLRADPADGVEVLLAQRPRDPFAGAWALPSGPLETDETLPQAIRRHLADKVGLREYSYAEQLVTSSAPGRDPFDRTVATSYVVVVPWDYHAPLPDGVAWHPVAELPAMAFDHDGLVRLGLDRLRAKVSYTNIGFALAPAAFRISDLAAAYAAVLGHDVDATNLQRILRRRGQLEATNKKSASGSEGGRPAQLFRFAQCQLVITDQFATLRPKAD